MKLIWHIVWKDLRSHWLPYVIWIGLLVAKVAICVALLSSRSANSEWYERATLAYWLAAIVETVLCFLLTAAMVLEDGLVGSNMFWATRPVSGARLLAAKAAGIGLWLCLVPVLVWLPWWAMGGYSAGDYAQAAFFVVSIQLVTVVSAALLACLSDRSSRFSLTILLLVAVFFIAAAIKGVDGGKLPAVPIAVSEARFWFSGTLAVIVIGIVLWLQFTTRRTARSVAVVVAGVCAVLLVANYWPWRVGFGRSKKSTTTVGAENAGLELLLIRPTTLSSGLPAAGHRSIEVICQARNLPEQSIINGGWLKLTHTWPDGFSYTHEISLSSGMAMVRGLPGNAVGMPPPLWKTDPETVAFNEKRMADRNVEMPPVDKLRYFQENSSHHVLRLSGKTVIPEAVFERFETSAPSTRIEASVFMSIPRIRLRMALPAQGQLTGDGVRLGIVADHIFIPTRSGAPEIKTQTLTVITSRPRLSQPLLYCVVHAKSGEVSPVSWPLGARVFIPARASFSRSMVSYSQPVVRRGDRWVVAPGTEEGYELVGFTWEPAGSVQIESQAGTTPWWNEKTDLRKTTTK